MTVIDIRGLRKSYGGRAVVHDVEFSVEEGEIFGILGPNGAGKSTSVECLTGLRERDGGAVKVLGLDPARDRQAVRERVGVQLQESRLPDKITVAEAMRLYSSFYPNPVDWRDLVDRLGLGDKVNSRFGKLSGGQKQRLSVALALVGRPKVAVLDELTTGLDPQARRDTWGLIESIRDSGVTLLIVTHFMDEAERLCDRLAVIDAGQTVAIDTAAGLVRRSGLPHRIRFRAVGERVEDLVAQLPTVSGVERRGEHLVVVGGEDSLTEIYEALHLRGVRVTDLRVNQPGLDDAFVELTGADRAAA
ncbi:ABC transporter ATP-binding protein [Actinoalloteichus caeruleus]|uniref:ABC transporter ATP-binding protein n=1 Tax=Actinoalloteichus cyanogriseus TaxID=2893586 RepID=UPI0004AAA8C4|nr:ABC transporter ATP-binding protein [Actinoalloteichus caeruleus]